MVSTIHLLSCVVISITLFGTAQISGLYIDFTNKKSETKSISHTVIYDKARVGRVLLDMLNLTDRPKRIKAPTVKRSASQYLTRIYQNNLKNSKHIVKRKELSWDFRKDIIDESDVIITYLGQNRLQNVTNTNKPDRGKRIWFDVTTTLGQFVAGEHWLYRNMKAIKSVNFHEFNISSYLVYRSDFGVREKLYLSSSYMTLKEEGWISLDVSPALNAWNQNPNENRGLFLAIERHGTPVKGIRPEDIGFVGVSANEPDKLPFLVGYFKNENKTDQKKIKRDVKNRFHTSEKENTSKCKRHSLRVNFKDLDWQDWIVAPEGYEAYYCSGECKYPLNEHMNGTNHAIVQALVNVIQPEKVPNPCCAPTKLSPISVIHFIDENNIVLKKFKNMVAESCGCQ